MAISQEALTEILNKQQEMFAKQQQQFMAMMTQQFNQQFDHQVEILQGKQNLNTNSADETAKTITEFTYDYKNGKIFASWYKRWMDLFENEFSHKNEEWKIRLLIRKLGTQEHERYTNYIIPKGATDFTFAETVELLKEIFGNKQSLFNTRFNFLKLQKSDDEDFVTFTGIVNRECEKFKLSSLTEEQFKCLIFIKGLTSESHSDIRARLLTKLENDKDVTIHALTNICNDLVKIKSDTILVQKQNTTPSTFNVQAKKVNKPLEACWFCGEMHYSQFCPFKKHKCNVCKKIGHKENFCEPRKNNGPKIQPRKKFVKNKHWNRQTAQTNSVFATFKTDYKSSRKYLVVSVNDKPIRFQFDTASDITLISQETWKYLGKP